MNRPIRIAGAFAAGLLGGLISTILTRSVPPVGAASFAQETTVKELQFVDAQNRTYAQLSQGNQIGSALTFFDKQGQVRLKMGLQPDGLQYLGLFSGKDSSNPKALLKLEGPQESSQLVLKDKWNNNRLVMGINPKDKAEEPFFVYFDKNGTRHSLFGTY